VPVISFELHLVVEIVRMILTHIVVPSGSTTGRTGDTVVDAVLKIHVAHTLKTLVSDDIVTEDIEIFLYHRTEIFAERLGVLHEVRVDIGLQTADSVIVLDESSTRCLLHDVEHMLTVTHTIEECCQGGEVLCAGSEEQQVVVDTLQLVHDGADVADAVAELYAHSLLNDADEGVTMVHGAEIVQSVSEGERLRIGHALHHLLHTAVDISEVRIDVLDGLTVNHSSQTKHTVGTRVVRTEVDDEVVVIEQRCLVSTRSPQSLRFHSDVQSLSGSSVMGNWLASQDSYQSPCEAASPGSRCA
jgi:hypothetical protein